MKAAFTLFVLLFGIIGSNAFATCTAKKPVPTPEPLNGPAVFSSSASFKSGQPGTIINWWVSPNGGVAIHTGGKELTTPIIPKTIIYYLEAIDSGCA